uniref:Uncharacterized protein n=1 Tax=Anguilla anguilla TaxID=7936 RepID=A0A0E9RXB8_ANGAN
MFKFLTSFSVFFSCYLLQACSFALVPRVCFHLFQRLCLFLCLL